MDSFEQFIDKKRNKLPNRSYEAKYPQHLTIIIDLLENATKKENYT